MDPRIRRQADAPWCTSGPPGLAGGSSAFRAPSVPHSLTCRVVVRLEAPALNARPKGVTPGNPARWRSLALADEPFAVLHSFLSRAASGFLEFNINAGRGCRRGVHVPYSIYRDLGGNGALIKKLSHWDVNLNKGGALPADFETPVEFKIDQSTPGREMPTLFVVPTFVVRRPFYDALVAAGVENVDAYPALIRDEPTGTEWKDYLFLNVVGVVKRSDLAASEARGTVPTPHVFRLAEDTLRVVVTDHVHERLRAAGFDDVFFQPVEGRSA
jgi:hypothetical protein